MTFRQQLLSSRTAVRCPPPEMAIENSKLSRISRSAISVFTFLLYFTNPSKLYCDHLAPTCYRNQLRLPRHLTRHSPSLLLKPGITYQQLFHLQHHFIFSLAISKRISSQLPSNSHLPSPEPLTQQYGAISKFIID